ncbi:unnamed protein product, partial [Meganyctiphanes norvegica]
MVTELGVEAVMDDGFGSYAKMVVIDEGGGEGMISEEYRDWSRTHIFSTTPKILSIFGPFGHPQNQKSLQSGAILEGLVSECERRVCSGSGGPATTIMVNMNVRSMGPFSEKQEHFKWIYYIHDVITLQLRNFNTLNVARIRKINLLLALWASNFFFGQRLHNDNVTQIEMQHIQHIAMMIRLTVRASCKMHLRKFPLDTQICPLSIASYGYNKKDMVYRWTSETPVSVDGDVSIAQYELVNISVSSATLTVRRTEEISILGLKFYLKRLTGFFLLQVYVPCILIVCCSWVAFWITKKDVPGRVALGVTTVLSMTTLGFGGRSAWPAVSYATALDYFVILCFAFVFAAVLEFACINFVERAANKRRIKYEKLKQTIRDRITAAENDGKMLVTTTITEEDINVHGSLKDALKIPLTVVPLSIPTIDEGEDETVVSAQAEVDAGLREALRLQLSVVPESVDAVQEEDKSPSSEEDKQKDGDEGAKDKDGTGGSAITEVGTDPAAGSEDGALDQTGGTSDLTVISVDLEEEEDEESEPPPPPPPFTVWQILTRKRHIMKHMTLANSVPTEDELLDSFSIIDVWARRLFPSSFFILFTTYWIMFNYYITDEFPNEGKQPADGLIVV